MKLKNKFFIFSLLFLCAPLFAASDTPETDTTFIEQQMKIKMEMEKSIQKILDHILGKGSSEVIVTVELEVKKESTSQSASTGKTETSSKFAENSFILPGLPNPKSVTGGERPKEEAASSSKAGATTYRYYLDIKKMLITVLYDKRIATSIIRRAEKAITDSLKLKATDKLEFVRAEFSNPLAGWMELLSPVKFILILLSLFLIYFLFGPVANFLKNLVHALREHGNTEVKVDSKFANEGEEGGGGGGGAAEEMAELEAKRLEEEKKKFQPFTYITEENLKRLIFLLRKESPEIIALVLSYIKPEWVITILNSLPEEQQAQVALNIATTRQMTQAQVMKIDNTIKERIDYLVGGLDSLFKVVNELDYRGKKNIFSYLKMAKPQLYEKIRKVVVMFEDIAAFPDFVMQVILREVKMEELAVALRDAPPEIKEKVFTNLSKGGMALLKEEMEYGRPMTEDQIEAERSKIVDVIVKLQKENKISIKEKAGDSGDLEGDEEIPGSIWEGIAQEAIAAAPQQQTAQAAAGADIRSYFQAGVAAYSNKQFEEAIQYFNYCAQANPNSWESYQYLGSIYYEMGYTQEAYQSFQAALQLNPNDPTLKQWVESLGTGV